MSDTSHKNIKHLIEILYCIPTACSLLLHENPQMKITSDNFTQTQRAQICKGFCVIS